MRIPEIKIKSKYLWISILLVLISAFGLWKIHNHRSSSEMMLDRWTYYLLEADRLVDGYRMPVAARSIALVYMGLYEVSRPFTDDFVMSLEELIPNFKSIDSSLWTNNLDRDAAINAYFFAMFNKLFFTAPSGLRSQFEQNYEHWRTVSKTEISDEAFTSSEEYGIMMAERIFNWSALDTLAHQGHLHNYDRNYKVGDKPGDWKPSQNFAMPALLPYWGKIKTMIVDKEAYLARPLPPYSTNVNSVYYAQALELVTMSRPLSNEDKWIAEFWSDDQPGITFSPAGRWVNITRQILAGSKYSFETAVEAYLKLSLALSDGAVVCWRSKYEYNFIRPETYIQQVFDPNWEPLHHSPSFPSYPSGHSVIGAAAAEVLTQIFGQDYYFVDRSHEDRVEFDGTPREFSSFYDAAFENAFSRLPLGVHFRMDCDEGLRIGFQLGKEISRISLKGVPTS